MKVLHKIKTLLSNLILKIMTIASRPPMYIRHAVPYVSQFANPSWVEMVLKDDQPINKDLHWEESGARSIAEYERWVLSTCGMACTAMLLSYFKKGDFKTIPLARDAASVGVYKKDGDGISLMQYPQYTRWIKKFNLRATVYTQLSYKSICYLLSKNILVLASVNPNICDFDVASKTQVGGHLVLLTGYNKKDKTITFHNPSGFENNGTQINHTMPHKVFTIYYAGKGIGVRNITS